MGAWGTSLYANDAASDIRGDYVDMLRRGKTNEEAMQELINSRKSIFGDVEEEPLFWFALADTQWNYGRLLDEVKEKALYFLSRTAELERWRESGQKQLDGWIKTREKLHAKLLTDQPLEKKVYKYRLYKCKWEFGDVFAYQFSSDYSKESNVFGKYIVFRKITEDLWWPGHIIPTVHVYMKFWDEIPSLDQLEGCELLPQKWMPLAHKNFPELEKEYLLDLIAGRASAIPNSLLTHLGNILDENIIPYTRYYNGTVAIEWKEFEQKILRQYTAWGGDTL